MIAAALSVTAAADARSVDGPVRSVAAPGADRDAVVSYARRFLGTPYVWGGASPAGFDCSGFTSYVYAKFGVRMVHYTGSQYAAYRKVPRNKLRAGDLVFFSGLGHMGIYIGRGRFIHSPSSGGVVRINDINDGWYRTSYVGAVRPPFPRSASRSTASAT